MGCSRSRHDRSGYDSASAQVIVGYGTHHDVRRTVTGASFRLPFKPDTAGHLIILLQDESRAVLTAAGITLRAGNLRFYWP